MKMTLLDMVQDILNDMSSDAVNTINDTEEALQVAQMIKTTYYEMWSRRLWAHSHKLSLLESVSDINYPNYLKVPEAIGTIKYIKYNRRKVDETRRRMTEMKYLHPEDFLDKLDHRNSDKSNITVIKDYGGSMLNIQNDKPPEWYTSFDDIIVVFDSWDKDVEDTVMGKESQIFHTETPRWEFRDNFVPDLPTKIFPALLAEAKSIATFKLKEEADEKAEQQSVRQQRRMSLDGWTVHKGMRYPNYGRQSAKAPRRRRPPIFGERT